MELSGEKEVKSVNVYVAVVGVIDIFLSLTV